MKTIITKKSDRGSADHGWLKPNHYFSFGGYDNPSRVHFGALRVINDDFIAGGGAFPAHPHDNMEIITIPFTGALQHKDSTGGTGIIKSGDVQIMSAGTGVRHSEANASSKESVTLFQVWIFPKEKNIKPAYDQRSFAVENRKNKWQIVVSPLQEDNALNINQDSKLALTSLDSNQTLNYKSSFPGSGFYVIPIKGDIDVEGITLNEKDAIGVSETSEINISTQSGAEVLLIEIPMNF